MIKLIRTLVILFIIGIIIHVKVLASSFELDAKIDKNIIKKGQEISIYLEITNIESNTGINAIQGNFEYNHNIFEFIKVEKLNNWNFTYNEKNDGKFIAVMLAKGENEQKSIGKITLKVKQDAKENETTIKIKNIVSSDEEEKIRVQDKEIKVKIQDIRYTNTKLNQERNNEKNNKIIKALIIILAILVPIIIYVIIKLQNRKS